MLADVFEKRFFFFYFFISSRFNRKISGIIYLYQRGIICNLSRVKLDQELCLETLRKRRWLCRLCFFYKIQKNKSPSYLFRLIPTTSRLHVTRNSNKLKGITDKYNFFNSSLFPSVFNELNKLNLKIPDLAILKSYIEFYQT